LNQQQIAKLARVSRATVSKALSGSAEVSPATRERIVGIAESARYEPHGAARTLASGRTGLIGFVPLRTGNVRIDMWAAAVIEGFSAALSGGGMDLVFVSENTRFGVPKMVAQRSVDGVVIITHPHERLLESIKSHSIPCVAANLGQVEGIDVVNSDSEGGVRLAVEHLASLGHRRIAYVNTPDVDRFHRATVEDRLHAFLKAAAEMGLTAAPGGQRHCDVRERVEILHGANPPTALLCYSDIVAMFVIQALHARGLRVPEDVSVVGIDDLADARHSTPPLTSVHVPFVEMGRRAGELLLARIAEPERPFESVELPEELVVRESTGPVRKTRDKSPSDRV